MKRLAALAALALVLPLAACSGGGSSETTSSGTTSAGGTGGTGGMASTGGTGGAGTGGMAVFALTSTGFAEGAEIPAKYACSGANVSPPLSWTSGPPGTLAYAVVLTDESNALVHWVIWDIPGAVTSLPEHVENTPSPAAPAGAKQVKSYDNQTFGYLGPCPPSVHTYRFAVHAIDVAALPNVTTGSTRAQVVAEISNHELGSASLGGTFTP